MNPELKQMNCIFCGTGFECEAIKKDDPLEKFNNCDMNCPKCGKAMFIDDGKLIDFNKYLIESYRSVGMEIPDGADMTKSFIEVPIPKKEEPPVYKAPLDRETFDKMFDDPNSILEL